jgi:hypothetical protein
VKLRLPLAFWFALLSCFDFAITQAHVAHDEAHYVSLIRLIANPKTFDGRRLRIAGYLDHNGIDRAVGIYVTEQDGQNFIISNSVDLRIDQASVGKLVGEYVIFEGNYHAPTGPLSEYLNGYFDKISELKQLTRGDVGNASGLAREH